MSWRPLTSARHAPARERQIWSARCGVAALVIATGFAVGPGTAAAEEAPIRAGAELFVEHCQTCHGKRMRNPQWGADLRTFPKDGRARFIDTVSYGRRNMPAWDDVLKAQDIEALWAYVSSGDPGD